jgi:hypothetical protein
MTISTTHIRKDFVGNGVTDTYPFDFPILHADHLLVYDAGGAKTRGVHYSVTGVLPGTGSVVFVLGSIPAVNAAVALVRSTPRTQETDLSAGAKFYESDIELMADKATMILQEIGSSGSSLPASAMYDYGSAAPVAGAFAKGFIRWNTAPVAGENIGWVNLTEGGCDFEAFGPISA